MQQLPAELIKERVELALREDVGDGDVTTLATIPEFRVCAARMVAREELVLAGLDFVVAAFETLSRDAVVTRGAKDGDLIPRGGVILRVRGPARAILTAERVALNFVQRMSGVATLTAAYVRAVAGTKARILDTRKTTPGWRALEKYAVAAGGGKNHRFGLYDMALIKDNHLAALRGEKPNPVAVAVGRVRQFRPGIKVEVEADTVEQAAMAADAGAAIILLDNMPAETMRQAVAVIRGRALIEASGGISLETARRVAECGVDFISVGALTHSARAVDIGLDFETDEGLA
jgi:nicotinate-nucleotide pyrophosphorylase (carboxylating)